MAMFDYRRASKELVFLKGLGMITYIIDCHRHTSLTSYQSEQPPTPLTKYGHGCAGAEVMPAKKVSRRHGSVKAKSKHPQ